VQQIATDATSRETGLKASLPCADKDKKPIDENYGAVSATVTVGC